VERCEKQLSDRGCRAESSVLMMYCTVWREVLQGAHHRLCCRPNQSCCRHKADSDSHCWIDKAAHTVAAAAAAAAAVVAASPAAGADTVADAVAAAGNCCRREVK
jgi:hypothetical protein